MNEWMNEWSWDCAVPPYSTQLYSTLHEYDILADIVLLDLRLLQQWVPISGRDPNWGAT